MKTYNSSVVYKDDLIHSEGALWCPLRPCFLFVDIVGKKIGELDPYTGKVKFIFLDRYVGTVVYNGQGELIAALQGAIVKILDNNGLYGILANLEAGKPGNRSNDGKCDPAGRLWVGTMAMDATPHAGALYCYDGKTVREIISGTTVSNGICWSDDAATMYYIDSAEQSVKAFDYDNETGNITNQRTVVTESGRDGVPDGMCIDADGMLWVAMWGGACVRCYDPATGTTIARVKVNAPNVSSCALGGKKNKQLFITTSGEGMGPDMLKQYPLSGSLFMAEVDAVAGKSYEFGSRIN